MSFEMSGDHRDTFPEEGNKLTMTSSMGEKRELVLTQRPYLNHAGNTVLKTLDRETMLRKSSYSIFRKVRMIRDIKRLYNYCRWMRYF